MAVRSVASTNSLETFRTTFNSLGTDVGDLSSLSTTAKGSIILAINEINTSVTGTGFTLSDGSNGGLASNYSISSGQTTTANITTKSVTVSGITASNKTYDAYALATVDVSSASFSGIVSGDNLSVSASGVFDNANVGTSKTVTLTSSYSGDDVNNYSITEPSTDDFNEFGDYLKVYDHLTKKNLQPLIIMTDQQKRLFTKVKSTTLNRTLGAKMSLLIKKYIDL